MASSSQTGKPITAFTFGTGTNTGFGSTPFGRSAGFGTTGFGTNNNGPNYGFGTVGTPNNENGSLKTSPSSNPFSPKSQGPTSFGTNGFLFSTATTSNIDQTIPPPVDQEIPSSIICRGFGYVIESDSLSVPSVPSTDRPNGKTVLENYLQEECSICHQPFQTEGDLIPFVLHCGHSFCKSDLTTLFNDQSSSSCPICQQEIHSSSYPNDFPPQNIPLLEHLLRNYSKNEIQRKEELCAECSHEGISFYCQDCHADLCSDCNNSLHQHRLLATHIRIPISEKTAIPIRLFCKSHPDEKLKLFCNESSCQIPVCLMCSVYGSHKDHNCQILQDVVNIEREKMINLMNQSEEEVLKLQEISEKLNQCGMTLRQQEEIFLQQLHEDATLAIAAIRRKEDEIMNEVKTKVTKLMSEFNKGMNSTAEMVADTASSYYLTKQSLLITNEATFLAEIQPLKLKLSSMIEKSEQLQKNLSKEVKLLTLQPSPGTRPLTDCILDALAEEL